MNEQRTVAHDNIFALHHHQIHPKCAEADNETNGAAPPDDRSAYEVELRLRVAPATHSQTKIQERPVKGQGCEDILLVRIRHEGVIRVHHGDVEMPEIAQERRLEVFDIGRRHYTVIVSD